MLPSADGWRLPYLRIENTWFSEAVRIHESFIAEFAPTFDFTLLRHLLYEESDEERWSRVLFVMEPRQAVEQAPLEGQWVDWAMLANLPLTNPDQRALLLNYLEENEQGEDSPLIDQRRSPWARPGWFASASAWIEEAIREQGFTQLGPVQQLRNWSISCLLTVPTSAGKLFFKAAATLPYFVNEPALMQTLSGLFPQFIPAPLKIDRERRWMLMPDFQLVKWDDPIDIAPVMAAFGELQRASADHLEELMAAGCIDRRLSVLATQIDPLIAEPETRAALQPEEFAFLETMAPTLKQLCARVATYQIPPALIHGDLHFGNITRHNESYHFFDWTDACISFPFVDHFMLYAGGEGTDDEGDAATQVAEEENAQRGRDAYLESWRAFESPEQLLEVWELARPLCALHHSISYLVIINSVEPSTRDELYHGFPDNLKLLIASLRS